MANYTNQSQSGTVMQSGFNKSPTDGIIDQLIKVTERLIMVENTNKAQSAKINALEAKIEELSTSKTTTRPTKTTRTN